LPHATLLPYTTLFRSPMNGGGVIVLHRVLDIEFPVAGEIVFVAPHADHVGETVGGEACREIAEIFSERLPVSGEIDEEESSPVLDRKSTRLNSSHLGT